MLIRPALPSDFGAVLALNAESVQYLSPLSMASLTQLHAGAEWHRVVEEAGEVVAFLLAFREGADYASINYRWFVERHPRFLYIDRVVVSRQFQSRGAGRLLYQAAFAHAAATGVPLLACEFDVEPPNPVSQRFHARFGFVEAGRQAVAGSNKLVSLQIATVMPQQGQGTPA